MRGNLCLATFMLSLLVLPFNNIKAVESKSYDSVIVQLKDEKNIKRTTKSIEKAINNEIIDVKKVVNDQSLYLLEFENNEDLTTETKLLEKNPAIKEVYPNYKYQAYKSANVEKRSNTCSTSSMWHLQSNYLNYNEVSRLGKGIEVGVVDTGVSYKHRELKGKISSKSYNYINNSKKAVDDDGDGHGTHVASILAGGHTGFNRKVSIVAYKVLDKDGFGTTYDIVRAVNKANKDKVKVLNMSLGIDQSYGVDKLLYNTIANYNGVVVAASGNYSQKHADYPAAFNLSNIISVNSVDKSHAKSYFSHSNKSQIDVATYGKDICAAKNGTTSSYTKKDGSSMSTPLVSATLAYMYANNPSLSPRQAKALINDNATYTASLKNSNRTNGRMNTLASVLASRSFATNKFNYAAHFAYLKAGSLYLYGSNDYGQLGSGNYKSLTKAQAKKYTLPNKQRIIKYYTTRRNTFVLANTGNVYVAGSNHKGQINNSGKGSTTFKLFKKLSSKDKIIGMDFRYNNKYNENAIIFILNNGRNYNYYRVGDGLKRYRSSKKYSSKTPVRINEYNQKIVSYTYYTNKYAFNKSEHYQYYKDGSKKRQRYINKSSQRQSTIYYYYKQNKLTKYQKNLIDNKKRKISFDQTTYRLTKVKKKYKTYKNKVTKITYKSGKTSYKHIKAYNKKGQLKSNKNGKAYLSITNYKKGKKTNYSKRFYTSKGKLEKRGKLITYKSNGKVKKSNPKYRF